MPPDHAESDRRSSGAGPWVETLLTKHSKFYRKHFTRDERRESKTERRSSVVGAAEEEIEQHRRESVAAEQGSGSDEGMKSSDAAEAGSKVDEERKL